MLNADSGFDSDSYESKEVLICLYGNQDKNYSIKNDL